jgi:succinate dehydrogenase / fumarate reductase membrane anchor subunit
VLDDTRVRDVNLRSPLGQVLGRGAAKEGVHHWWLQRLTSVALGPLTLWFVVALLQLPDFGYVTVTHWLSHTLTALLLILFVSAAAWHSQLGLRVIIEDYAHGSGTRIVLLMLSTFMHVLLAGAGILSVLQILFRGAA